MQPEMFEPSEQHAHEESWKRAPHSRAALARALVEGGVAGPVTSHDRRNVLWKIERLVSGDPGLQFGLSGLSPISSERVLALMAAETGFSADPWLLEGPSAIDPFLVLQACEAAGRRLAVAAERGERALLATGHPAGPILLYIAVARLLEDFGAKLIRPGNGRSWRVAGRHHEIRYLHGVATLADRGGGKHTHSPDPMERMLEEDRPDVVLADHGFAGAAIEAGIETISIADVNDPAPVVAKAQGRTELVIVMDDNVQSEAYWPCFQAIAGMFPP